MLITDEKFFCSELDTSVEGLNGIDNTYRTDGLAAAEKQLADFVRANMRSEDYFKTPYYARENAWYHPGEDDYAVSERVMQGRMISCGFEYQFPNGIIDWEHNPTDNGLKEWTWQLSRHHEWRCLAHCYKETGDEKYTKAYIKLFMSWIDQAICPENAHGGATHCWRTLEAGLRMVKIWHYAFLSFYRSPLMTDHIITTYMKSIWEHGYRLRRSTSAANWLTSELTGLAHMGMLYPFFRNAADWKEYALRRLDEEIDLQFYPDGFHYELTTGYHGVVTSNYRYLLDISSALSEPLPTGLAGKLEVMYEMYPKLAAPDWKTPALNDGGRTSVKAGCADGAHYFPEREDYKYFASGGKEGRLPDYTSVAMPYSGMATMRTDWSENAVWFFMESAPFGRGHQHEDKLNVCMFAYGKDVLSDCGSYSYDSSEMRKFILDTRSHNCALIDNLSQRRRPKYNWRPEEITERSNLRWSFAESVDTVEGFYNGDYGDQPLHAVHKRHAIFFKRGISGSHPFVIVIDRLSADDGKEHEFAVSYQMNIQPYTVDGKIYTADHGDGVTMSVIGAVEPRVIVAQTEPIYIGWRPKHAAGGTNPEHYPAPCLQYVKNGVSARIVTVLYPSDNGQVAIMDISAGDRVDDTDITLTFSDGSVITLNENDYPCSLDSAEKF
ncbi:MAG: alginate lyase family protein [Clostridia bacterium]|nr:alginate lyase family protein [Clostridia bacterium]